MLKLKLKIASTNWINLLVVIAAVYIWGVVATIIRDYEDAKLINLIVQSTFGSFILLLYGIIMFPCFIVALVILDFMLMNAHSKYLKWKLLAEWLLISSPFIYWMFKYSECPFVIGVLAFAFGQYIRQKRVLAIMQQHICLLESKIDAFDNLSK